MQRIGPLDRDRRVGMTYGQMLEVQARMPAAYVRGELPRYVGFTVR
jgi:hypothetical protein